MSMPCHGMVCGVVHVMRFTPWTRTCTGTRILAKGLIGWNKQDRQRKEISCCHACSAWRHGTVPRLAANTIAPIGPQWTKSQTLFQNTNPRQHQSTVSATSVLNRWFNQSRCLQRLTYKEQRKEEVMTEYELNIWWCLGEYLPNKLLLVSLRYNFQQQKKQRRRHDWN